ncbi:MAG: carbohydrate ABC transporter permease [Acidimicrobiia bacterium]|nr:carbohydrate ABC transporter permease [Acidimicrobiia bacterium]
MTVDTKTRQETESPAPLGTRLYNKLSRGGTKVIVWILAIVWLVPTLGLFISSFRSESDIKTTGWWTWFSDPSVTLDNYDFVLFGTGSAAPGMGDALLNSLAIVIPATIIPIAIAAFAAYAFAWMDFPGRNWIFILLVSLLAVPIQMSLIPLLQLYVGGAHLGIFGLDMTIFPDLDLQGTSFSVWATHTGFGMPLAVFLLTNYMSTLPRDVIESARIDGGDHFTIFWKLIVPLSVPALAAFAIFQFLWTWNDYLIAVTFVGSAENVAPVTVVLANVTGSRGQDWHILTAAAFVSMVLPLTVFFSLQRYFVSGLLAGSTKG